MGGEEEGKEREKLTEVSPFSMPLPRLGSAHPPRSCPCCHPQHAPSPNLTLSIIYLVSALLNSPRLVRGVVGVACHSSPVSALLGIEPR